MFFLETILLKVRGIMHQEQIIHCRQSDIMSAKMYRPAQLGASEQGCRPILEFSRQKRGCGLAQVSGQPLGGLGFPAFRLLKL